MKLSSLGRMLTGDSGTLALMDDLGQASGGDRDMINLGGGNPSHIPEMESVFRARLQALVQREGVFERITGYYDGPAGDPEFAQALAALLRAELGWDIGPENVCITNGSQSAFFALFNLLGGPGDDGVDRKILLPLAPEYIGYADVGLAPGLFRSFRPTIEHLVDKTFKYRVDFDRLEVGEDVAAICVSRPTNPTGNVLTDQEIERLGELARAADVPLILDNAYGTPFPHIVFNDATPSWDDNTVVCMSLSKLGLPGLRTGIVIANPEIIRALSSMNAILSLAPGSMGPALVTDLVRSGEVLRLSNEVIKPHYQARAERSLDILRTELADYDIHIHKPEGAIFLWLWCRDFPTTNTDLYQRLKARGVIVVSGQYFFPGLEHDDWVHKSECVRITYADDLDKVERGIRIVAEEVRRAYEDPLGSG